MKKERRQNPYSPQYIEHRITIEQLAILFSTLYRETETPVEKEQYTYTGTQHSTDSTHIYTFTHVETIHPYTDTTHRHTYEPSPVETQPIPHH